MGLFDFDLVQRPDERASTDFVARRKPCADFENYQPRFKEVQKDLKESNRSIIDFKLGIMIPLTVMLYNSDIESL